MYTLNNNGFEVIKNEAISKIVLNYSTDLEQIATNKQSLDVFRTNDGFIKQIQHLDFEDLNSMLAKLITDKNYEVLNNQYFCKPPNYKETSPHQDNAYFNSNDEIYTFWIPLQDVDEYNSCMCYVPNSHKEGLLPHSAIGTNIRTRTGKTGVSLYSNYYSYSDFVAIPMKKGEILVHDKNTMHYSTKNQSNNYRYAITSIIKIIN